MARDIDGLLIQIEASTASLRSELKRADAAVANATKGIDKQLSVVDKAFANIGVTAGRARQAANTAMIGIAAGAATAVAGVTALTKQVIDSAREIQNFSSVSNSTTLEFQRFAAGAKAVGIEQEKLADQLKDVNDRIGQFATSGSGEMAQFFEKIAPRVGVTAEQFRKLSGPQALQLYYNSLEKAGLNQQEMTAYMEAMADESTALIPLLRNGGEGFKLLGDEAERAGAILDDKAIRAAQEMNAALILMTNATGGVKNRIATALLPVLLDFSEGLNTLSVDSAAASIVTDDLAQSLRVLGQGAVGAVAAIHLAGKSIKGIYDLNEASKGDGSWWETFVPPVRIYRAIESIDDIKESFGNTTSDLDDVANSWADFLKKIGGEDGDQANSKIKTLADLLNEARETAGSFIPPANSAAKAIEKVDKALDGVDADGPAKAIKEFKDRFDDLHDSLNPAEVAARKYKDQQEFLNEVIARGGEEAVKATRDLDLLREQYEANNQATSEWAQWTEGALERVDSAFADAWRNIGDGFSSFRDSLTNAFKQMLAELAHMAITRPIIMQIGASMGIGGGAGQAVSMMGGGSAGGINYGQLASYGQSAYSALTGWGQAAYTGWQNGGVTGAYNGVTGYYGDMFSGAYNTVSGALGYGNGANIAGYTGQAYANWAAGGSQAIGASQAGYTGAQYSAWVGQQNAAATAGTYAPWLSAASGAYMGYQQSGAKGAVAGGVGGWGGAKLGASAGSYFGPIGTAVGAVIGGILGATVGSSVFGGDWETRNSGLAFSAKDGEFIGQAYEDQKKKGGLFSSDKKRTRYSALDEETATALQEAYDATESGVSDLLARIGVSVNDGAYAGLEIARRKISTKGKTEEEIQAAIAEWFEFAADRMIAEIDQGISGFGYSLEELTQRINVFEGVNDSLELINVAVMDLSAHSMELANGMAEAAGGMEAFSAGITTYYQSFFTAAEQQEKTLQALLETFEASNLVLAASREEYREMVEAIDVTTEAGRELFNTLMALSGQAATYYSIVEQQAAQAYNDAVGIAQNAFGKLQESVAAERRALDDEYNAKLGVINAARDAVGSAIGRLRSAIEVEQDRLRSEQKAALDRVSELAGLSDSLRSGLRSMRLESEQFDRMRRDQAKGQISSALALARSGGSLQGLDLSDALSELSNSDTDGFASFEEYARDYWRTANDINELAGLTDAQLSVDEQIAKSLEEQSASLGEMLAAAQSQYDALLGIDNAVLAVGDAVALFESSLVAAQQTASNAEIQQLEQQRAESTAYFDQMLLDAQNELNALMGIDTSVKSVAAALANFKVAVSAAVAKNAAAPKTAKQTIADTYQSVFGRDAGSGEVNYWLQRIGEGTATTGNLANLFKASDEYKSKVPGFASGGFHSGGLRLVGEDGPELEVTGPSRIYNASQTAAMLNGGGDTARAIAGLQQSVERQGDALRSIAKHTMQTAKRVEFLERWDYDGLPTERDVA